MMTKSHLLFDAVVHIVRRRAAARLLTVFAGVFSSVVAMSFAQTPTRTPEPPKTLGIEQGTLTFQTADFDLKLLRSSQTVAALLPKGANGFDFTPADWLDRRASDGFYHLGDIRFSVRVGS